MSEQNPNHATDQWNKEIQREKKERKYPKWPNEAMLKILFGGDTYLKAPFRPQPSWRVLDVGCECHGVDLTPEMASTGRVTEKLIQLPLDFLVALCR